MTGKYEDSWMKSEIPYTIESVDRREFDMLQLKLKKDERYSDFILVYNPRASVVGFSLNEADERPISGDENIPNDIIRAKLRGAHSFLSRFLDSEKILEGPWEK